MRVLLVLLLLCAGLAGCLGGSDSSTLEAAPDAGTPAGTPAFRCPEASAPCLEPVLPQAVQAVRASLQDPGRTLAVAIDGTVQVPTLVHYLPSVTLFLSDDGESWRASPLPPLPVRPEEARHSIVGIDVMQTPDGALHALLAVRLVPVLTSHEGTRIPEPMGFLAYATAPDGEAWHDMVRLDGGAIYAPHLHWFEDGVRATWYADGGLALAPVTALAEPEVFPHGCYQHDAVTHDGAVFLACQPGTFGQDPSTVWRMDLAESKLRRVVVPCSPGTLVVDDGLWFVSTGCDQMQVSRYNGTAFAPVHSVRVGDVPALASAEKLFVMSADRDVTGTWHVAVDASRDSGRVPYCSCWESWRAYVALGPDGAVAADAVLWEGRSETVHGDRSVGAIWDWHVRSLGGSTLILAIDEVESTTKGSWVDVVPA